MGPTMSAPFRVTPWQGVVQANQLRLSLAINGWTTLMMSMTALRVLMEPMFRSSVSYVQVCMYKVVSAWCFCTTLCRRHKLANWTLVWVEMTALR